MNKEKLKKGVDEDLKNVEKKSKAFWKEFKEFAIKGNAIDLAVGMVVGSAFTSIVTSLVNDIITPLIGALTGGLDFSEWFISLDGTHYNTLTEAKEAGAAILTYGNFITAVINFLIVALVIFIVFKKILVPHNKKQTVEETPAPVTEKECPYCKSTININATRCPHCTSELE